jgi:hypothetical protein
MARQNIRPEANKSGFNAVKMGMHRTEAARSSRSPAPKIYRMPAKYTMHDLELLIEVLFMMFTETQSRKLRVAVPWDDSDEPETMVLADLVALLESWQE